MHFNPVSDRRQAILLMVYFNDHLKLWLIVWQEKRAFILFEFDAYFSLAFDKRL